MFEILPEGNHEATENAAQADGSEIPIDGMEPAVLEKFLQFIYTNRVGKIGRSCS
jgi:hypothetical protein